MKAPEFIKIWVEKDNAEVSFGRKRRRSIRYKIEDVNYQKGEVYLIVLAKEKPL